ncbi:MAG: preprotein translocase subunit SecE [Candidatus Uhrbacteria bacterium]|nr:preprotein translocase subunit SecE [Candidatus Uhrbacteria bacterium]MDP3794048.1 preprotein translocase subunit SecE [Candidatus Uhrbacteria bacterium]
MNIVEYLKSSKAELEKVSWPSRQDTIRYSALVVVVSVVVAVFFAALDFGLSKGVEGLLVRGVAPATAQTQPTTQEKPIDVSGVQVEGITPSGETVPLNVAPIK